MFEIKLSQGKVALVDDEYTWLDEVKWSASKQGKSSNPVFYACRVIGSRTPDQKMLLMHRVILEKMIGRPLARGEQCDHIDHDGLNNVISNLRVTTTQENHCNQRVQGIVKSSKYKGVTWDKNRSKWMAKIKRFGKYINLGRFVEEDDAARAYDLASIKYHGEFGYLNFR